MDGYVPSQFIRDLQARSVTPVTFARPELTDEVLDTPAYQRIDPPLPITSDIPLTPTPNDTDHRPRARSLADADRELAALLHETA